MRREIANIMDMAELNAQAKKARRLLTDIIRQTSIKPYYGKRGAAVFYCTADTSEAQRQRIDEVTAHLEAANQLLYTIGIEGGMTDAALQEIIKGDYIKTHIQE